jgi:hypothetical protein
MVEASLVNFAELGVLTVGVVIALQQLRDLKKTREVELETRQAQIFWNTIDKAFSKEGLDHWRVLNNVTWSSYEEWLELRRDDIEYNNAYLWISQLYESIGASVRLGHTDIKLLAHCMPRNHLRWWERYRDVVYSQRKRLNSRRYCSEWEYLYNELVKYLEEHPELAP